MSNETCQSSGSLAIGADRVVSGRPCKISAIQLNPGSAASTITIYDHPSASSGATVIAVLVSPANGASVSLLPDAPIECLKGCVAVVAGTAATGFVYFAAM